jgi:hypothetical protein
MIPPNIMRVMDNKLVVKHPTNNEKITSTAPKPTIAPPTPL